MTPLPAGHLSGRARDCKSHANFELTLLAQREASVDATLVNAKGARWAPCRDRASVRL